MINLHDYICGKKILVTGGTGSIGSVVVRELLRYNPSVIRIFSRDETKQFEMLHEMNNPKLRFLVGDIRDRQRIMRACEDIDIIIHAAALKQVPSCEYNPQEAVLTNILGTQHVIDAALENNVDRMVLISTDKVVAPTNVYGSTKLVAERLTLAAYLLRGQRRTTKFAVVRFGNVLYSRGSVLTLWKKQLENFNKITLTDPLMTRFFMSINDAVLLSLRALTHAKNSEVFVLKMPVVNMQTMARLFIEKYGNTTSTIDIIGPRPGEKRHEELLQANEAEYALETDDMFVVPTQAHEYLGDRVLQVYEWPKTKQTSYRSDQLPLMSDDQIRSII